MKICNKCNLEIIDKTNICPLCKSKLEDILEQNDSINLEDNTTYPIILNHLHRYNIAIRIMLLISIITGILCLIVNYFITKKIYWSIVCIAGIIYCWITTMYSVKKNINMAAHIFLQTICLSVMSIIVDDVFGYIGWSYNLAIPIITTIANLTMFVLLIIAYRRYFKYIFYQLLITIISFIPLIFFKFNIIVYPLPIIISIVFATVTFICTIIFCSKDIKDEITRRFHF
ncbi:MAG: DUF6320 domain-containing protein [Clostridia bacterium]